VGVLVAIAVAASVWAAGAVASVGLPDGRLWEMVSPPDKNGGGIARIGGIAGGGVAQASANGENVTYVSLASFAGGQGAPIGSQYLSKRGVGGWTTQNMTTPMISQSYLFLGYGTPYVAFSTDLSAGLVLNGAGGGSLGHPVENAPLDPNAPAGYLNYYLRSSSPEELRALLTSPPLEATPEGPSEFRLELLGASPDLQHVVVASGAVLAPGAVNYHAGVAGDIYEWSDGGFRAVSVLPGVSNGETAAGSTSLGAGIPGGGDLSRAVSATGSRVVWTASGRLYDREFTGAVPSTVQVDASHGPGASGGGIFSTASSDGSRVFFVDSNRLTPDATANGSEDLYEYDVESEELRDLTVDAVDANGAAVQGVLGASEDGSYVYFVALGVLPGTAGAVAGEPNLYVWHGEGAGPGTVTRVATLSSEDERDWQERESTAHDPVRISGDGREVVFVSHRSLTGFDNEDQIVPERRDSEVFRYEAGAPGPVCVSCNPSGARPIGDSTIPAGTPFEAGGQTVFYRSRVLSSDGRRVFFDSEDALVPQDTNSAQDVYEWEAEGEGGCEEPGGCLALISGGTGGEGSSFIDASESGEDVFFITGEQLAKGDADRQVDLYDARVGDGFAEEAPAPAPCAGEGCRGTVSPPPVFGAPATVGVGASDNLAATPVPMVAAASTAKPKPKVKRRPKTRKRRGRAGAHRRAVTAKRGIRHGSSKRKGQ
jgi:hypothetical protein